MHTIYYYIFDEESATTVPIPIEESALAPQELEFFDGTIRKVWHKQKEEWYFSVVDVCQVLTDSADGRKYWNKLKQRLTEEGNETVTNCHQLKLKASDGKMRRTDCATTEELLRIIQSIPSKKAEPFKQWLARVGAERLDEMADPEKALDRGLSYYRAKGYSEGWIRERLKSKEIRDELTDEWQRSGIKEAKDYALLTNLLTQAWSDKSIQAYKQYKGLHKENLRDNMTNLELTLNQLAEVSATAISKAKNPSGLSASKQVVIDGGTIAKNARLELEKQIGQSVISPLNANQPAALDVKPK